MYLLLSHCVSVVLICGFLAEPLSQVSSDWSYVWGAGLVWLFRVTFLLATAASQDTNSFPLTPQPQGFAPRDT